MGFQQAFRSPLRLWWDDAMNHFDPLVVSCGQRGRGRRLCDDGSSCAARGVCHQSAEAYIYLLGVAEAHAVVRRLVPRGQRCHPTRISVGCVTHWARYWTCRADRAHGIYEYLGFVGEAAGSYYTIGDKSLGVRHEHSSRAVRSLCGQAPRHQWEPLTASSSACGAFCTHGGPR